MTGYKIINDVSMLPLGTYTARIVGETGRGGFELEVDIPKKPTVRRKAIVNVLVLERGSDYEISTHGGKCVIREFRVIVNGVVIAFFKDRDANNRYYQDVTLNCKIVTYLETMEKALQCEAVFADQEDRTKLNGAFRGVSRDSYGNLTY